jgi:2-oxoglutarate dehydrogenase E1 component
LKSKTNPVRERRDHNVNLDHKSVGLTDADLDTEFDVAAEIGMPNQAFVKSLKN